jgi:hypothetical protein
MRGGAQSHLVEAEDGNWYVVKFRNNPQHRRILVNEIVCSALLDYLKIAAPETAMIQIGEDFLAANREAHIAIGSRRIEIEPGVHFGSKYPGNPGRIAVYDYLPDALLSQVVNLQDFRAVLVFDKWVGNADGRQSIFFRAMVRREDSRGGRPGFVAQMIDHGFAFGGPGWEFNDSPVQGLYPRHSVYDSARSLDDFQPWLDQIAGFPEEVIDRAWKRIPAQWTDGEEDELEQMLVRLYERRKRVSELIAACRSGRANPFRNWAMAAGI